MAVMSHVLGLARLLDEVEDDPSFLAAADQALAILLDTEPPAAEVLLDLIGPRLDRALTTE